MLHDCNANTKDAQTLTHPFLVVKKDGYVLGKCDGRQYV